MSCSIDDFKVNNKAIGVGQFGSVYSCVKKSTGKELAIKFIETVCYERNEYDRFIRDILNISRLNHPAILPIYDWGECCLFCLNDVSYFITPLMKNHSLAKYIDQQKINQFTPTQKMIILYGSAVGMKFLHDNGIIHNNLKPSNILIDELYRPYISDFMFAKYIKKTGFSSYSIRSEAPFYTAPEILENEKKNISEKADVYSFGIIVFNMLTGQQFSDIKNIQSLANFVLEGNRPNIPSNINSFYADLIQRCWNQSPEKRPSFDEIVHELEKEDNWLNYTDKEEFVNYKNYLNK